MMSRQCLSECNFLQIQFEDEFFHRQRQVLFAPPFCDLIIFNLIFEVLLNPKCYFFFFFFPSFQYYELKIDKKLFKPQMRYKAHLEIFYQDPNVYNKILITQQVYFFTQLMQHSNRLDFFPIVYFRLSVIDIDSSNSGTS